MPTFEGGATTKPIPAPVGKPHPLLLHNNVPDVETLNTRARAAVQAHEQATGQRPSPHLVYDLVRSDLPVEQFPDLFRVTSPQQAQVQKALARNPLRPENDMDRGALKALGNVTSRDQLDALFSPDMEEQWQVMLDGPDRTRIARAYVQAVHRIRQRERDPNRRGQALVEQGLPVSSGFLSDALGVLAKAGQQISTALVLGPPTLAIAEGRAIGKSVTTHSPKPLVDVNVKLAKGIVKGVAQDVTHPGENPGYLFLDALGVASFGLGASARVAAAGRVFAEGGTLGAAAKAAARRPVGGTATLRKGGFEEEVPLTENQLFRSAQRWLIGQRNKRMEKRLEADAPAGILGVARSGRVQDTLDMLLDPVKATFSSENKLGREARARRMVEQQIALSVKHDLDNVAGWTNTTSRVFAYVNRRLPERVRGLTVGEQKAIQILSTDDINPVQAWRDFHQRMIDQAPLFIPDDPAAMRAFIDNHRAQLQAISLAEKALTDPRPRFQKALALTREAVAEQERIKIEELGLSPVTAERRVIKTGEFARGEEPGTTAVRVRPESFYLPFRPKGKPRRGVSENLTTFSPQRGPGGIPVPRDLPELKHEFTGSSLTAGDFRIDATTLAGDTYAATVKAASKLNEWRKLWNAAREKPTNLRWERPIRDIADFPDELRAILERNVDAELTAEEAASLHPAGVQELEKFLFPGKRNERTGRWELDEPVANVRWVDYRLIDQYRAPIPREIKAIGQAVNEPFRDIALFLRPAYILNLVGNVGMGLIDQGVLLPINVLRGIRAETLYGERVARQLDALGGQSGRSASYAAQDVQTRITAPGRFLSRSWNVVTDQHLRRAAIIHELRRQAREVGVDPNEIGRMIDPPTNDPLHDKIVRARNEGVRRGNKAMVQFDNLTWFEREALRHLIFVYPWTSRALVWSIRTMVEHPVQTDVLTQIGRQAEDELPDVLQKVPAWFKQIGYVPVGFDKDGNPKVVNASSVNTFSTLSQLLYPLQAGFTHTPYSSLSDLYGPAAQFFLRASTGKDEFGNEYPGSQWWGAARDVLLQLPQLRPAQRKKGEAAKQIDLSKRDTLITQLNSALKETVFTPGWLQGYGSLIAGGLSPRAAEPLALEARWYRDATLEQRHALERSLIAKALRLQADLVKAPVSREVKDAVALGVEAEFRLKQQAKLIGRDPTAKERAQNWIDTLDAAGRLGDDKAVLEKKLKGIVDPAQIDRFQAGLLDKYAGAKDLREWDERVRYVWSFRPAVVRAKLARLRAAGLTDVRDVPDQETLYEWGRRAWKYRAEAKRRASAVDNTAYTTGAERSLAEAELRSWQDAQNKSVVVNGQRLPSPVQIEWANLTPADQRDHLVSASRKDWSQLSNFDKQLLGVRAPEVASQAWEQLYRWLAEAQAQLPVGKRLPAGTKAYYARVIAQQVPEFRSELRFAELPLANRLAKETVVTRSRYKSEWAELLGGAQDWRRKLLAAGWKPSQIAEDWRRQRVPAVREWLDEHPAFRREVETFGPEFLSGLVSP